MNIIEAMKSGNRFKRKSYLLFHSCRKDCPLQFSREEVLADDWEIEEEKRQITKSQLEKILSKVFEFNVCSPHIKTTLRELGFKE